jgi:hypothetical protein
MQKIFLLASFLLLTTTLLGQSKPDKTTIVGDSRVETFYYQKTNYDSLRLSHNKLSP